MLSARAAALLQTPLGILLFTLVLMVQLPSPTMAVVRGTTSGHDHYDGFTNNNDNTDHKSSTTTSTRPPLTANHVLRHLTVSSQSFHLTVQGYAQPLFQCYKEQEDCGTNPILEEQNDIWNQIVNVYCPTATLVQSNYKLINSLTINVPFTCLELPTTTENSDEGPKNDDVSDTQRLDAIHTFVQQLVLQESNNNLIQRAYPSGMYYSMTTLNESMEYLGALKTTRDFCVNGQGVRIAILDSGIDYTHQALGGNGTSTAYTDAYGFSATDVANTIRGPYFPTNRVVDGYDFVGDIVGSNLGENNNNVDWSQISADEDPIDGWLGHGTAVAHALLGVAGEASLLAVKVCSTTVGCPESSILQGLEYALDPNGDGNPNDAVDIINLSLGRPFTHPYYSPLAQALEDAFSLGVLTVVAAGNNGNRPGILFEAAATPNSFAVGATGVAESSLTGGMAAYSSRGPGAAATLGVVKPDISAPGGPFDLAASGTGNIYHKAIEGTSYAAPLVAGAAALLIQRCPECSPLAIKSILMNNAHRSIRYTGVDESKLAPISWAGAGELRIYKAISADVWAYTVQDAQPSVNLGLLNIDKDVTITKTIRVTLLDSFSSTTPLTLRPSFQFRDPDKASFMTVAFSQDTVALTRSCQQEVDVEVSFRFTARNVPSNHMTSAGQDSVDPVLSLDTNEVDGWVIFTDISHQVGKDITLPMHGMVRQASNVKAATNDLVGVVASQEERFVPVGLRNIGAGTAQIDTYELVHVSVDDPEFGFGSGRPPTDIRYVGYRTVPVMPGSGRCDYLVEFAFHTWETVETTVNSFFEAEIDRDLDGSPDVLISNRGPQQHRTNYTESRVFNYETARWSCAFFPPDHGVHSKNTVIRACSNDLGLDASSATTMQVRFKAVSYSQGFVTTDSPVAFAPIAFPNPSLRGPSFNLATSAEWGELLIEGSGQTPDGQEAMGLVLITNGYRSKSSTGASTSDSEALVLTRPWVPIYPEITGESLVAPKATDLDGPLCSAWKAQVAQTCNPFNNPAISSVLSFDELFGIPVQPNQEGPPVNGETCAEARVPRLEVSTLFPTMSPTNPPGRPTDGQSGDPLDPSDPSIQDKSAGIYHRNVFLTIALLALVLAS